jgi:DNA-binding GntR family transcriptional regulator
MHEKLAHNLTIPSRRPLSDEVAARLRQAILSGQLAPGEELREPSLAQSMGVSRGPVREALKLLEREGLVIKETHKRAVVARLSRQDLEEINSLRTALERLAVQYACRQATPADLAEMEMLVNRMEECVQQGITQHEIADFDSRFHDALYRASHHQHLYALWETLRPQVTILLLSRFAAHADAGSQTVEAHRAILDSIRGQDEARALALTEGNLRATYEFVVQSYQQEGMRDEG